VFIKTEELNVNKAFYCNTTYEYFGKDIMTISTATPLVNSARTCGFDYAGDLRWVITEKAKEMNKKDIYLLTNTAEGYFAKKGFFQINRSQIPYELLKNSCLNFSCPSTSICMKLKILT